MLTSTQQLLATTLFRIGAVQFGAFRLKHHETHPNDPLSPIYFNLRTCSHASRGPLLNGHLVMIGQALCELVGRAELRFNALTGIPEAGVPIANALGVLLPPNPLTQRQPYFALLRKEVHGEHRHIAALAPGSHRPGHILLLVDDVLSRGDTKLEAAAAIRRAGCLVHDLAVVVDREQGGREEMQRNDIAVHALFSITELLRFYQETGEITAAKAEEVRAYLATA